MVLEQEQQPHNDGWNLLIAVWATAALLRVAVGYQRPT
jgi:hypothetical protein